ncbi:sensor domain-containing diguanylate cyclase [Candidatus Magnetaquicoccus inordinatus]|uniref:sensor domain-containing diguanylate cyclase n=1 Tax=Candidatus Magnetaquicoccus inordinatus TaxID=2496818 RepID=UPI00102BEBFD|nr:sensor domain-containing diguanylate cyclase [Candidatus Magnetaquicoccus inordinatus]
MDIQVAHPGQLAVDPSMEERYQRALTAKIVRNAVLETIVETLSMARQIEVMLEIIFAVPWLSRHNKGILFLVDESANQLILAGYKNIPEALLNQCARVTLGECDCGSTAQARETQFFTTPLHATHCAGLAPHNSYRVPLLFHGQLLGLLAIYLNEGHPYLADEEAFLTAIAAPMAMALHHRRREEQVRKAEAKIRHLAYHDVLTGLRNRQSFDEIIDSIYQKLQKHTRRGNDSWQNSAFLAILDIDHFKKVNDTYGHLIGDEVLVTFARLMEKTFRDQDFVFRFGGEEFVVLLVNLTEEQAFAALDRFRYTVENHPFPQVNRVTVSQGAIEIKPTEMPGTLMEKADKALYFAKQNGRNQVRFYQKLVAEGAIEESDFGTEDNVDLW